MPKSAEAPAQPVSPGLARQEASHLFEFMRHRPGRPVSWGEESASYLSFPRQWLALLDLPLGAVEAFRRRMYETLHAWQDNDLVATCTGMPTALDLCALTDKGRVELASEFFGEEYVAPPKMDVQP